MDRRCIYAYPNPTFCFDADPDPDSTPSFANVGKSDLFLLLFRQLLYFVFFISVIGGRIIIIRTVSKIFWKKVQCGFIFG